jgi:uncharacterized membrane protein
MSRGVVEVVAAVVFIDHNFSLSGYKFNCFNTTGLKMVLKKKIIYFKLIFFLCVFKLFWCADIKNNFFKKYIILMYFQIKNTLKNNYYYTLKIY